MWGVADVPAWMGGGLREKDTGMCVAESLLVHPKLSQHCLSQMYFWKRVLRRGISGQKLSWCHSFLNSGQHYVPSACPVPAAGLRGGHRDE